jgi:hypothetical protein
MSRAGFQPHILVFGVSESWGLQIALPLRSSFFFWCNFASLILLLGTFPVDTRCNRGLFKETVQRNALVYFPCMVSVECSSVPVAPTWEHRPSAKRFVSLQFLNLRQSVGLLGRRIGPSQGRYITQTQNKHRHPCFEWIRTHDPSF